MDLGDRSSMNAGYLTDESVTEWNTISSDGTVSGSESNLDTVTSRPPSSPGSHPPAGNPSSSHSVLTADPPPSHPGPAGNPPPSPPGPPVGNPPLLPLGLPVGNPPLSPPGLPVGNPPPSPLGLPVGNPPPLHSVSMDDHPPLPSRPAGNPPPSHSVPTMDAHSPPSAEPQHPGTPEFENFIDKLMKGKFKHRISGYGPGNVVQRVLQDVARYRWFLHVRHYPFIPPSSTDAQTTQVTNILIFFCSIVRDLEIIE
jgi:hypothetical protein